ncbi:MAG: HD-GYP domain-containing protein [Dehalococcoidia bacterium]
MLPIPDSPSTAAIAVEAATRYHELDLMFHSFVETITATIDARDRQTAGHSRRVSIYAAAIARELVLSEEEVEVMRLAGLLHDVGKIGVPEAVLTKPGPLTVEERRQVQLHAAISGDVLNRMHLFGLNQALPKMAAEHHERPDGKGYPLGLTEEEISLGGRILGVADCFDALTNHRYYRNAMTYEEAYAYMLPLRDSQFAPEPLEALGRAMNSTEFAALIEIGKPIATLSSDQSASGTLT